MLGVGCGVGARAGLQIEGGLAAGTLLARGAFEGVVVAGGQVDGAGAGHSPALHP